MKTKRTQLRGFTLLEMLIATVIGVMVVTGSVILFIGGIRLSLGMQATSHALRSGANGIDRLRLEFTEATAYQLPDDSDPFASWDSSLLGSAKQYHTTTKNLEFNTALYLSLPNPRIMQFRTASTKVQSTSVTVRRTVNRGALLYRGDLEGKPNPENGTALWMWTYVEGKPVARVVLSRKLSTAPDAVSFRRGNASGTNLRYRLVQAEKDSYNQARSGLGNDSASLLEASEFAITLLNNTGGSVPESALPAKGSTHP